MRLGPGVARVLVWEEGGRIYLKWQSAAHWADIKQSLRETLPRHGQLNYDSGRQRWSVPATMRQRLEQWLAWMFTRDVVEWVDDEPATFSRRGRLSNSNVAADRGALEAAS